MQTIINITPGLIPIPPNGWGAVEKIIWEIHKNLLTLGYDSQIKYLSEVTPESGIVHIHVANLANEAHKLGIPYYFTFHDHHAYLYGKESPVYKENLRAIKNAVKAFVPAKYLVDYFDGIPEYFSHGVDSLYFTEPKNVTTHKLLCVANNGYIYDQSYDRKGFGVAIAAAQRLELPITIVGPSNNKNYFNSNPVQYDKLTVLYDLSEEELLTIYREHSIFVHASELEAGHPNLTLVEALSCGLPVVGTFESNNKLDGLVTVERNIDSVVDGITKVIENYSSYRKSARQQAERLDWHNRTKELMSIYLNNEYPDMKKQLISHYSNTPILKKPIARKHNFHCIDGMFAETLGGPDTKYRVKFIDKKTNNLLYETELSRNCWAKANVKYYVDWKVEIIDTTSNYIKIYDLNLQGNRVYIALDSKSLGDTIAWFPYVEEFRKKHKCEVICSTFWNDFFKEQYPEITFVSPGETVHNLAAMYTIGLFYTDEGFDGAKHPNNPIHIPLQKIASDILGLEYKEVRPKIKQPELDNTDSKVVTIGVHSTAQSKYWNNPMGWQQVVDWLKDRGYTVKLLSQEEDGYMGNRNPIGVEQFPPSHISKVIEELKRSKVFIGVSSGLSWLSWAVGTPTVMISGFTEPMNEMQSCIRISAPKGMCSGCWNRHRFNAGDWNWCPDHKGTPRQFECSREITAESVISELEKLLEPVVNDSYAGPVKKFTMIDVPNKNFNNQLTTSDESFWNGIYLDNKYGWWGNKSKSGEGSEGSFAEYKKTLLNTLIQKYPIKSIVDFGCGDFNWMKDVTGLSKYVGVDIVRFLIEEHNKTYKSDVHNFIYGNIANTKFHPDFIKHHGTKFDMGILFDILGHQLWDEIETSLDFILNKLDIKYLLVSNDKNCNPDYWKEKTTRNQSVDVEIHPLMIQRGFRVVETFNNNLVLYEISRRNT